MIWYFSSSKSLHQAQKVRKWTLQSIYADCTFSYEKLLTEPWNVHMHIQRARALCIEIFKTIHVNNLKSIKYIFTVKNSNRPGRNPNDLIHHRLKNTNFGYNNWASDSGGHLTDYWEGMKLQLSRQHWNRRSV